MRIVKKYIRTMSGESKPLLVSDMAGIRWVIKYPNNGQGVRVLANEWVCYHLAKYLELPVPEFDLVDLPQSIIDDSRLGNGYGEPIAPGTCFGSGYIDRKMAHTQILGTQMGKLVNGDVLPGIVIFDRWVGSLDHVDNDGNLLVSEINAKPPQFRYHLIDLGIIQGLDWSVLSLADKRDHFHMPSRNPLFNKYTNSWVTFDGHLKRLERMPLLVIERAVRSICPAWGVSIQEKDGLISYLNYRRTRVRAAITSQYKSNP